MNLIELSDQERHWLEALTHVNEDGETISEEEQSRIIDAYIQANDEFVGKSESRPLRRDSLCPAGATLVSTMPAPSGDSGGATR